MSGSMAYVGQELELFAHAAHWKAYLRRQIEPHLRGAVLEVGAGNGSNTQSLLHSKASVGSWTCLEPDPALAGAIRERGLVLPNGQSVAVQVGTSAAMKAGELFDTILYIDVLEHIEHDAAETTRALSLLRPGGRLVVLAPAHQFLFSPFDTAIGHFRRYDRKSLLRVAPPDGRLLGMHYLDSVGLFASLANRFLMKQGNPSLPQILFWDRVLVRLSRLMDPLLGYQVGKSLLGVWEKV